MRDDLGGSRPRKGAKMKVQTIYVSEQPAKHLAKQDVAKLNQLEEGNLLKRLKKRMKISPRGLEEKTESLEGTFLYDQLLPILQRFILIGAMPIQRQANGRVTAKLCSFTSLYCICVYLLSLPLLLMTGRDMVQHALVSEDFDEILMSQLFSTILIPYLLTPVSFWLDAGQIAEYLNDWETFQADVERHCRCHLIGDYKLLWLTLYGLTSRYGYAVYHIYGVNFLVTFWLMTSSLYASMSSLLTGNYLMCAVFVKFTFFVGAPFYIKCNAAHWVALHVKNDIDKELHHLSATVTDSESLEEMQSFLRATSSNKPAISLGGYATVNRQMCQAVAATVVTYLIVLLQFQLSLPATVANSNSTTTNITSHFSQ